MSRKKKIKSSRKKSAAKGGKHKRRASVDVLPIKGRTLSIILLAATALAMGPVLTNGFVTIDDEHFILTNPIVQDHLFAQAFTKQLWSPHYKPLVYISWALEHLLFGNSSFVFHGTNWLLHLVNTWLVFICFRQISTFWKRTRPVAEPVAFFTALLFGVHPLHVESVAWAIERKDVLFTCFYLLATWHYLRFHETGKSKHVYLSALLYIGSLLSKSMGITFIAIPFLIDFAAGRTDWRKAIIQKWPYLIGLVLALLVYGFFYTPLSGPGSEGALATSILPETGFGQALAIGNFRYLFFLAHVLFPVHLAQIYPREFFLESLGDGIYLGFAMTIAVVALPFIFRKYKTLLLWGLLFFTITLMPILLEEGPGTNFASDRYTYVPSIGIWFVVTALLLYKLRGRVGRTTVGVVGLSLIAILMGVGTFMQAAKWGDSARLITQAIDNYPDNWLALGYRAEAIERDDPAAAMEDYNKSLAINPAHQRALFGRGSLYLDAGQNEEAIADLTQAIAVNPRHWRAYVNRGNAYRSMGDNQRAIADYNVVLNNNPDFIKALNNRGVAYLNLGQIDAALQDFNRVLALDPGYVNGYINRAALYINSRVRQYEQALADYNTALSLEPDNAQATYYRGWTLHQLGRPGEALTSVDAAITLRPNTGLYHFTKAQILRDLGRYAESAQAARQAQTLGYQVPAGWLQ